MPRKFVISLCLLNLIIAIALLWFFIPRQRSGHSLPKIADAQQVEQLTEDELWDRAKRSTSLREAISHLSKTTDNNRLDGEIESLLTILEGKDALPFSQWSFYQGLLQLHSSNADAVEGLTVLQTIFKSKAAPLTFKNLTFTLYVENCLRLKQAAQSYKFIDIAFKESNSLKGMALRADNFLLSKDIENPPRQEQLMKRCTSILMASDALESNQLTAIEILASSHSNASLIPLEMIFQNAKSERVQNVCLQLVVKSTKQDEPLQWIQSIQPASPQQEQLLAQIKHR